LLKAKELEIELDEERSHKAEILVELDAISAQLDAASAGRCVGFADVSYSYAREREMIEGGAHVVASSARACACQQTVSGGSHLLTCVMYLYLDMPFTNTGAGQVVGLKKALAAAHVELDGSKAAVDSLNRQLEEQVATAASGSETLVAERDAMKASVDELSL
jgi:hypothetical protein